MNETSQLIVKTENDTDIFDHGNPGRNLSSQYSIDSFRSSALSFTDLMSESMKRIGVLGSLSIAVNSLTGPAMLCLPATYQRSGLIPTTAAIIFVCILSALCCLHMSNSISKVPNNQNFGLDVSRIKFRTKISKYVHHSNAFSETQSKSTPNPTNL